MVDYTLPQTAQIADYTSAAQPTQPISVDTTPVPDQIDLAPGQAPTNVSPVTAAIRAMKMAYANTNPPKSMDEFQQDISQGQEPQLRQQAAALVDQQKSSDLQGKITDIVNNSAPDDLTGQSFAISQAITAASKPTNPQTVVEEKFAKEYMDSLNWAKPMSDDHGFWYDAQMTVPNHMDESMGLGREVTAYREQAIKKLQDVEDKIKDQSYAGWGWDQLKINTPILGSLNTELSLRGNAASYLPNILAPGLGDALDRERSALLQMPFPEYTARLDQILDGMSSNPSLQAMFLQGVIGQSTSDAYLNNMFTFAQSIPELGSVLKGTAGLSKLTFRAVQADRAIKSMIKGAEVIPDRPPEVAAPAAAGDLKTATTNNLTDQVNHALQGVPDQEKDMVNSLVSVLRADAEQEAANPGIGGQAMANRMTEDASTFMTKIINGITNVVQVERIPAVLATKTAVKALQDEMVQTIKGMSDNIINAGEPERNTLTNTYHVPFYIGDKEGYFTHASQADNAARLNGLVPSEVTKIREVNEKFGIEWSRLDQRARDIKAEIKAGPAMDADVHELNRHADLPNKLIEVNKKIDDLQAWHATELTNPDNQGTKQLGLGYKVESTDNLPAQYTIGQQGRGFYIKVYKPLNETDNIVRDNLLATSESKSPNAAFKDFTGWLGTPEGNLSMTQNMNRKVAAYAPSVLHRILKENATYISDLFAGKINKDPITGEKIGFLQKRIQVARDTGSGIPFTKSKAKTMMDDWKRLVDNGRRLPDGVDESGKVRYGRFYDHPAEFEQAYLAAYQRMPEPIETTAYFAFKRNYEADRMFRNIMDYRMASRLGVEEHSFSVRDVDGSIKESPFIRGVARKQMTTGNGTILILDKDQEGLGRIVRNMSPPEANKYREKVLKGELSFYEVFDPERRALNGFDNVTNERVRYVLAKTAKTRPLNIDGIPRRGGGHVEWDYDYYIKQPKIRSESVGRQLKHWYEGDTTVMAMQNRALGVKMAEHLDQVREHLNNNDIDAAKSHAIAHLPIDWDELHGYFKPTKSPNGKVELPRLSKTERIQLIPKNKRIVDVDNSLSKSFETRDAQGNIHNTFEDGTRSGSLARQYEVQFGQERDAEGLMTINDYGTKKNPLYKYEPGQMVDPMTTMNRALNKITNSMFMDDYKVQAVEAWLREAAPHLNVKGSKDPESELRSAPFYHFYKPEYKSGTDLNIESRLRNRHFQIQQFIGQPSVADKILHHYSQKLADSVYTKFGPGPLLFGKRVYLAPSWALANISEPFRMARTVAHHFALGFWSLPQFIAQNMTYATILGVSGSSRAVPGTMAAFLHQLGRLNADPAWIDHMDMIASHPKMQLPGMSYFKPGEFKEARNLMTRTGFDHVGAEHSMLERIYQPRIVSNAGHQFLDSGDIIFKGGERNARFGAWYTAYLEFRETNPTGAINNIDLQRILQRADLLSGNMTRASKSALQMGIMSYPAQFLGYQLRLAELFTGSRLGDTLQERNLNRARMVATFATLFGVPSAMGVTGFPAGDYLRKYAAENGYNVGENWWSTLFMEGPVSMALMAATGEGDFHKGNQYNVGARFGSPGIDLVRDALSSDKPYYDLMQGAAGSIFEGMWTQTSNLRRGIMAMLTGKSDQYPLKPEDFTDILKNISMVSKVWQTAAAINTGKYFSRNETNMKDHVSATNAIFLGVTGLQPQDAYDTQINAQRLKTDHDMQTAGQKEFIKEYHRWLEALDNKDPQQAMDYQKRAQAILEAYGIPEEKRGDMIATASKGYETLVNRLQDQLVKAPPSDTNLTGTPRSTIRRNSREEFLKLQTLRGDR